MPVCASRNLPIFLVWTAEFEPLHTSTLPAKPSAFLSPSSLRDCPGQVKDSKWMGSNTNRLDLTRQKSGTRSRRLFLMTWICNEFYLDSELRRMELISNAVVTVFYCILQWDMKHDSAKCWKSSWIWFLTKPLSSWLIMHMSFFLYFIKVHALAPPSVKCLLSPRMYLILVFFHLLMCYLLLRCMRQSSVFSCENESVIQYLLILIKIELIWSNPWPCRVRFESQPAAMLFPVPTLSFH